MQPESGAACPAENSPDRAELTEHELAQEKLYLLWRSGRVQGANVTAWARSLERLGAEGECSYLCWLFKTHPPLSDPQVQAYL